MRHDGWRTVKLGDVASEVRESCSDPVAQGIRRCVRGEDFDSGEIAVTRWGAVPDDMGPTFTKRFRPGHVLYMTRRAYLRKAGSVDFDGVAANTTLVLEAIREELLPELLPYILQSEQFTEYAVGVSVGSTNPFTKWSDLRKYEFEIPSMDRQKRAVTTLREASAAHDAARALETKTWRLRAARLRLALSDLRRAYPSRLLGDVADWTTGRAFPSDDYNDTGIRLLRPGNMGANGRLRWPTRNTTRLPMTYRDDNPDLVVRDGDVIMNLTAQSKDDGFLGRVCIATPADESLLNQRLAILNFADQLVPAFGALALQSVDFRRYIEPRGKGTTVTHIYWNDVSRFSLPLPPREDQLKIVDEMSKIDAIASSAAAHTQTSSQLKSVLQHTLFRRPA